MKFNLGDLERLFEQIRDIIDYVEVANLKSRRNTIFLSNGDNITYCVPEYSIAHLLGININYLMGTKIFKSTSAFELLKEMADNPFKIDSLDNSHIIDQKQLFSEQIKEKISSFKENIKINIYETEFVCKYNKARSYYNSETNEICDYVIVKKYEDGKIGVILLAKNNVLYVPMSNRIYKNIEEASEYLNNLLIGQEITLLSGCTAYNIDEDYEKKFVLRPFHKKEKFDILEEYKKSFNCSIDMCSDYKYISNKLFEKRDERYENNTTVDGIVLAISKGEIINRDYYENSTLLSIIDAWNDYACNKPNANNNGTISYTDAIKELNKAKDLIIELEKDKLNLEKENTTLSNENTKLTEENKEYKEKTEKIMQILKKPEN